MSAATHPPDRPPDPAPQSPESRTSCADCGAPVRSAFRRGRDRQLREHLICTNCEGVVKILPPQPAATRQQNEPDQLVSEAADYTEELADVATRIQRTLLARAWGSSGPLPIHRARAYHGVLLAALAMVSEENVDRLAIKLERDVSGQTARFRGWHRASKRERWQAVVSAESEESAWQQMLTAVAGGDKTVTDGTDPNEQRRPR